MSAALDTTPTDITCDCAVHNSTVTIRVPASMLVNPSGKRTTPKYRATVVHNLIHMNALFGKYEVV